jgi:hypothetical protein
MFSPPMIFQHFMEESIILGLHMTQKWFVIPLITLDVTDPAWHGTASGFKATCTRMQ